MNNTRPPDRPTVAPRASGEPYSMLWLALRMMPVGVVVFLVLILSQPGPKLILSPAGIEAASREAAGVSGSPALALPRNESTMDGALDRPGTPPTPRSARAAQGRHGSGGVAAIRTAGPADVELAMAGGSDQGAVGPADGADVSNRLDLSDMSAWPARPGNGAGTGLPGTPESTTPVPASSSNPAVEYGIEVSSLRVAAGGNALDFRYKVVDPAKAATVGREGGAAYILAPNGQRISPRNVQQIGDYYSARHLDQPGVTYSTWFANQGGALRSGDIVSVVIGDLHVSNVRVE